MLILSKILKNVIGMGLILALIMELTRKNGLRPGRWSQRAICLVEKFIVDG